MLAFLQSKRASWKRKDSRDFQNISILKSTLDSALEARVGHTFPHY
jgi:hypothetical protein